MMDIVAERAKTLPDLIADPTTMLTGEILNFYLTAWLPRQRMDEDTMKSVHFFETDMYTYVKDKLDKNILEPPRKSDMVELRAKVFRRFDKSILCKDLLVWPIHVTEYKHWILAIIQNPDGAIRRKRVVVENDDNDDPNNNRSDLGMGHEKFQIDEKKPCRILIMDSLMGTSKYGEKLEKTYEECARNLKIWMQLAGTFMEDIVIQNRIQTVICRNLPIQNNSFDCGLFVLAFAEYFAIWKTDWMSASDDEVENMVLDDSVEQSLLDGTSRTRLHNLIVSSRGNKSAPAVEQKPRISHVS